eukprot:5012764-Prymnesium_polylepis.1
MHTVNECENAKRPQNSRETYSRDDYRETAADETANRALIGHTRSLNHNHPPHAHHAVAFCSTHGH